MLLTGLLHSISHGLIVLLKCLLKELKLSLDILAHILAIELGNRIQFHDDLRSSVLERLSRVDLPAGSAVLRHVERPVRRYLALNLHVIKNALLQESFRRDHLIWRRFVALEFLPDTCR